MFTKKKKEFREFLWGCGCLNCCPQCGNKELIEHGFDDFMFSKYFTCDVCGWGKNDK